MCSLVVGVEVETVVEVAVIECAMRIVVGEERSLRHAETVAATKSAVLLLVLRVLPTFSFARAVRIAWRGLRR